jgi:peroxiredoxin
MTQTTTRKLDVGDLFPSFTLTTVNGPTLHLPEDTSGRWCVFQVYRAHW